MYWIIVAVDTSGGVYVTGTVSRALDGQTFTGTPASTTDIVLLKYNTSGNWQWTRLKGSPLTDIGYGGEKSNPFAHCSVPLLTIYIFCLLSGCG